MGQFENALPGLLDSLPAVRLEDCPDADEAPTTSTGLPRNPDFTAARLFSQKPHLIPIIIGMLRESIPIIKIARTLQISINTVVAIRNRCPAEVDAGRKNIAESCRTAARITAEAIMEDLSDDERRARIPYRDKAIALGVLIDKAELLSGGVTARIAHEYPVQLPDGTAHDAYNDFLRTGQGSIIDVTPEPSSIDSPADDLAQMGADPERDPAPAGDGLGGSGDGSGPAGSPGVAPAAAAPGDGTPTTGCGLGVK